MLLFLMIFVGIILCLAFPIIGIPLIILCVFAELIHVSVIGKYVCPECKETVKGNATVCKHCGAKFVSKK